MWYGVLCGCRCVSRRLSCAMHTTNDIYTQSVLECGVCWSVLECETVCYVGVDAYPDVYLARDAHH